MIRKLGANRAIRVRSSVLASGWDYTDDDEETVPEYAARLAYEAAGLGPSDIDVIELHDASAPAELIYYEYLGLAPRGEGVRLIEEGATSLGGRRPVNPSGGLLRKGHPIGASGAAQIYELVTQLRGEAGARQAAGARTALAENGGGMLGADVAAIVVSVLTREA
jgi:acetyl-CoA acetyltransferase